MSEKLNLNRNVFEKRKYQNTIDTSFSELILPPLPPEDTFTVEEFFDLYTSLFYDIPAEGEVNSHQFLIQRSKEYIGFTEEISDEIQVLLDEITSLRQNLLNADQQILELQLSQSLNNE
jgi:hypothetical protein